MSSNEIAGQPTQSGEEQTASAANAVSANPPLWQRPNLVHHFKRGVYLGAGVLVVVLVIGAVFFAGFFTGRHYGDHWSDNYYAGPQEGTCIQIRCQPAGPKWGAYCRQVIVPCP
jgi:hypothetical protein